MKRILQKIPFSSDWLGLKYIFVSCISRLVYLFNFKIDFYLYISFIFKYFDYTFSYLARDSYEKNYRSVSEDRLKTTERFLPVREYCWWNTANVLKQYLLAKRNPLSWERYKYAARNESIVYPTSETEDLIKQNTSDTKQKRYAW